MNTNDAEKKTILLVEDEQDVISFYSTVLSDYFRILIASSGEIALKQARGTDDIDLTILDYKLPDMSGMEVLQELKRIRPSMPVLVVTAFGDEDVAVKSFRLGARDYIKKPFSGSDLLERIDFYLSFRRPGEGSRRSVPFDAHDATTNLSSGTVTPAHSYKIQKALKYINDNYRAKIGLAVAAQKACLSKYHFSRTFKEVTGMTYREYLNKCRIDKVKEMLERSAVSITEAAFSVGYVDLRHFERMFKKVTGVTPSYYKTLRASEKAR